MNTLHKLGVVSAIIVAGALIWLAQQAGSSEYDAYRERLACVGCPEPECPIGWPQCGDGS